MIHLLLQAVAVTATFEASLPRLILSCRVSRGYPYEDRVTRFKNTDTLVDSLPGLDEVVPLAMKATLNGSYEIYNLMLKLYVLFAKLWAMQLKNVPVDLVLSKQVRMTGVVVPKEVSKIIDKVIAVNQQMPSWNDVIESLVNTVVTELKRSIQDMASSLESLSKHLTEGRVNRCANAFRGFHCEEFFNLLSEEIQSVVAATPRSPALTYMLTAKSNFAIAKSNMNSSLIRRVHKQLYCASIAAIAMDLTKVSLPKLCRILAMEKAAMVSGTFSQSHRLSFIDLSPEQFRYPGDHESLTVIDEKAEELKSLERLLERTNSQLKSIGNEAMANGSITANSRLYEISKVFREMSRKREIEFSKLELLRQEFLAKGYAYYKDAPSV